MSDTSVARHAEMMAYLNRKLDLREREIALREREMALDEQRLQLLQTERERQVEQHQHMHDSLDRLRSLIAEAHGDDDGIDPLMMRGRASGRA